MFLGLGKASRFQSCLPERSKSRIGRPFCFLLLFVPSIQFSFTMTENNQPKVTLSEPFPHLKKSLSNVQNFPDTHKQIILLQSGQMLTVRPCWSVRHKLPHTHASFRYVLVRTRFSETKQAQFIILPKHRQNKDICSSQITNQLRLPPLSHSINSTATLASLAPFSKSLIENPKYYYSLQGALTEIPFIPYMMCFSYYL